jgi:general secretion pathway protein B
VSFILDALRKSEHERQRQTGPALAELPVATPKSRSNVWAPAAIALLLVNLVVVGVLLIRNSLRDTRAPAAAVVATPPASTPPASTSRAPMAEQSTAAGNTAAMTAAPPATLRPAEPPKAPVGQAQNPLEAETSITPPTLDPQMAAQASAAPPGPPAVTRAPVSRGSVVYESLPDSAAVGGQPTQRADASRLAAGAGSGLPSADELASFGIPALKLDLHMYSTVAAERLVFINAHKYREGDTLPEGPEVRQITPSGVVLEYKGRSYLLAHD